MLWLLRLEILIAKVLQRHNKQLEIAICFSKSLIVIVGSTTSSIEYNRAKDGIAINIKIILGKNGPNNLYSSSMNNPFWNWISFIVKMP
jgi:hypothetical protein